MNKELECCTICPHNCKINRTKNPGRCKSKDKIKIALYSIHNFDEAEDRNFDEIEEEVLEKFSRLQEIGVIEDEDKFAPDYKLIIFDVFR